MEPDYSKSARVVIRSCLGVKPNEKVLVICDTETERFGRPLFNEALNAEAEATLIIMKPRSRHGEEPPEQVAAAMRSVDVFVAPTKYSLTHTQARKAATQAGVRGATMPGINDAIFLSEAMVADYNDVKNRVEKMGRALQNVKKVVITSPAGCNLTLHIDGRPIILDTGIIHNKGDFGNLPAGEVYVAPLEGTAEGTIVFDGTIASIGQVTRPVVIKVKNGYTTSFEGGEEAAKLEKMLKGVGKPEAFNIAELGIGCNPHARLMGNLLIDEKVYNTIHIALGDNSTFGGKTIAGIHIDGVVLRPTVIVDDEKTIIKDGEWLI